MRSGEVVRAREGIMNRGRFRFAAGLLRCTSLRDGESVEPQSYVSLFVGVPDATV